MYVMQQNVYVHDHYIHVNIHPQMDGKQQFTNTNNNEETKIIINETDTRRRERLYNIEVSWVSV
jgi:hypothetical protein